VCSGCRSAGRSAAKQLAAGQGLVRGSKAAEQAEAAQQLVLLGFSK